MNADLLVVRRYVLQRLNTDHIYVVEHTTFNDDSLESSLPLICRFKLDILGLFKQWLFFIILSTTKCNIFSLLVWNVFKASAYSILKNVFFLFVVSLFFVLFLFLFVCFLPFHIPYYKNNKSQCYVNLSYLEQPYFGRDVGLCF